MVAQSHINPKNNQLRHILTTHSMLLDTCFAMQPGFTNFVKTYRDVFESNPILISSLVVKELDKLLQHSEPEKRRLAQTANQLVRELINCKEAEVRGEACDSFADQVIQRVVEQHMLTKNIVVLTNDAPLMRDIRAKTRKESVRTRCSLQVIKLHAKTGEAVLFVENSQTSGGPKPSATRNTRKNARSATSIPESVIGELKPFDLVTTSVKVDRSRIPSGLPVDTGSQLKGSNGSRLTLGPAIASGGEGRVFELLESNAVCKIYFDECLTRDRLAKIELMLTRKIDHPGICWPTEIVRDQQGNFRGYVMKRAAGKTLGHTLFLPHIFAANPASWTRRESTKLALSILDCIRFLHDMNILIGDINPQNILLDTANRVFFVDCDSFQIEGFPCPVGTINFTAPELQDRGFGDLLRSKEHELFAVATLLFMIFFPGKTPYCHSGGADGAANIRSMEFPYATDWQNNPHSAPRGVWMYCWSHLSGKLKHLFLLAFERQHAGKPRVKLVQWIRALQEYAQDLQAPGQTFMGPQPKIGYDLSIMPRNKRYKLGEEDSLPTDGKTGFDRMLERMRMIDQSGRSTVANVRATSNFQPNVRRNHRTQSSSSGSSVPSRNHRSALASPTAHTQTFDPHATQTALSRLYRRRTWAAGLGILTTFVVVMVASSAVGSYAYGGLLFLLFIAGAAMDRELTHRQYYSIPGSKFDNGDHRCIYCGNRGSNGRGIYTHGQYKSHKKFHDCSKCSKNLYVNK